VSAIRQRLGGGRRGPSALPRRRAGTSAVLVATSALLSTAFLALLAVLTPSLAQAHDVRPGVVGLEAHEPGRYNLHVEPPVDAEGATSAVHVVFPAGCSEREGIVECDRPSMRGLLSVEGLETAAVRMVVHVVHHDGETEQYVLTATANTVDIGGHGVDGGLLGWVALGIEHILRGVDHLAFVLALMLVTGLNRRLVATLTAFTVGHSLTLALHVLGFIPTSSRAVEAIIAASVLFLAVEASQGQRPATAAATTPASSLTNQNPWLVAGGFGLVHGLGFASVLRELRLPAGGTVKALFGFNVGVELGQLAFVASCALVLAVVGRLPGRVSRWFASPSAWRLAIYALGGVAAWWTFARLAALARFVVAPLMGPS
jgi:hypothetical protein